MSRWVDTINMDSLHDVDRQPDDVQCDMCHQWVPSADTSRFWGRLLCLGCLLGWYDDEDGDGESEN